MTTPDNPYVIPEPDPTADLILCQAEECEERLDHILDRIDQTIDPITELCDGCTAQGVSDA